MGQVALGQPPKVSRAGPVGWILIGAVLLFLAVYWQVAIVDPKLIGGTAELFALFWAVLAAFCFAVAGWLWFKPPLGPVW